MAVTRIAESVRNAMLDAINTKLNAGPAAAQVKFYSGTMPANADTALSGNTLLAELVCSDPAAPAADDGTLTFSTISADISANASGPASFARLTDSTGLTVVDMDVGDAVTNPTAAILLADADITAGSLVGLNSLTIGLTGEPPATTPESIPWDSVTGKPSTFPPSAHGHAIADVTGLQTALNSKLALAGGTMTGLLTLAIAPTAALDAASKQYVDQQVADALASSGFSAEYQAKTTTTTAADPGSGYVVWNVAGQTTATELYIDALTAGGVDGSNAWREVGMGRHIKIQDKANSAQYQEFVTSGPAVENTGWFTLPVTAGASAGGVFTNNEVLAIVVAGASGVEYLPLSGGTLTGPLTLAADPAAALQASTKQYADTKAPLANPTFSTGITVTGNVLPEANNTRDLGSSALRFHDLRLANIIYYGSGLFYDVGTGTIYNSSQYNWAGAGGSPNFLNLQATVMRPGVDNTSALGAASFRWTIVYATTGTINTCDVNEKQIRGPMTSAEVAAFSALQTNMFQYRDAIAQKGPQNARLHVGYNAQDMNALLAQNGLNPSEYAVWCEDPIELPPQVPGDPPVPSGQSRQGLRLEHILMAKIAALEARVAALEAVR